MAGIGKESDKPLNVYAHRAALHQFVRAGVLSEEVLGYLLPDGDPFEYERELWDYKLELPWISPGEQGSAAVTERVNLAMSEVVKDCAAFFNSYGGYIVAGIQNSPRVLAGYSGEFDCDALNKRLHAALGQKVECFYRTFDWHVEAGGVVRLGVLFIPQRVDEVVPAQFQKDAPPRENGKRAYSRKDIYFRTGDECRKAESSEDYGFLCTPGRRLLTFSGPGTSAAPVLDSNLGPRDESFIEFIGREYHLGTLWEWFFDKFSVVRLLAGVGGVGKTTLAREFAEQVVRAAPFGFQKVVWLSAKKQTYTAIKGRYVSAGRVDFEDVDDVLRQICLELGLLEEEVPPEASREALLEATVQALTEMPSLVVIDDVDSLEPEEQQDLFHAIIASFSRTVTGSGVGSRALLTARLDLGAAPGQVIRVKGLQAEEFQDFVEMTCSALDIGEATRTTVIKRVRRLLEISEGSPTFAASILRLVSLGENVDKAIRKWAGTDGEEVRRFAFERELEQLTDSARAVLYALFILGDSTLVELGVVVTRTEQQVRDNMAELRKYHLVAQGDAHLPGGSQISAPGTLRMMRSILREKVREPSRIEASCAKARSSVPKARRNLRPEIGRIAALWSNGQAREALEMALALEKQFPGDPDIKFVVGRANLRLPEPDFRRAEIAFRKAQEIGCQRTELISLWVETKAALGDWNGVLEITTPKSGEVPAVEMLLARAEARRRLIQVDLGVRNYRAASERALEEGREIDRAFRQRRAFGAVAELRELRRQFLTEYVSMVDRYTGSADEQIDVWIAVSNAFDCFVRSPRLLRLGVNRLRNWWSSVEGRNRHLASTESALGAQLGRLRQMIGIMKTQEYRNQSLEEWLAGALNELENRRAKYLEDLNS